jgi:hypothetical protein
MSYTFEDEFIISRPVPVSISSVDTTRITVPNLEAGFRYTFNVTSQNRVGAASALCELLISASGKFEYQHASNAKLMHVIVSLSPSILLSLSHYIDQSSTQTENITAIIVGGVVGGLVALGFIIGFATFLMFLCLRRKGMQSVNAYRSMYDPLVHDIVK